MIRLYKTSFKRTKNIVIAKTTARNCKSNCMQNLTTKKSVITVQTEHEKKNLKNDLVFRR